MIAPIYTFQEPIDNLTANMSLAQKTQDNGKLESNILNATTTIFARNFSNSKGMHKTRLSHVTKQEIALIENDNTAISDISWKVPQLENITNNIRSRKKKRDCDDNEIGVPT